MYGGPNPSTAGGTSGFPQLLQLPPADNKPYFDDVNPRNVTTVVDDTAVLKCRVKHKGNRTVSSICLNNRYTAPRWFAYHGHDSPTQFWRGDTK